MHLSMCYDAMADCSRLAGDLNQAAQYYYEGFLVSQFPGMWIKHARALFDHNPKLRLVAMRKIRAFMARETDWREEGGTRLIEFPVDSAPARTCVAYADLLWKLDPSEVGEADLKRTCGQLLHHLRRAALESGSLEIRVAYALAKGATYPLVRAEVCRLIENAGLGARAPQAEQVAFPSPILAGAEGVRLLGALGAGLWRAGAYDQEVALSVVRRIGKSPDMIRTQPDLGRALAHLLWRCVLQAYYRGASDGKAFRDMTYEIVSPLVALFHWKDLELLRDWTFELVAADKASVEYGLVTDYLERVQSELLEPYTRDLTNVARRLHTQGMKDLRDLVSRLQTPEAILSHRTFADLAADTAEYVITTLPQFVKTLIEVSIRQAGVRFYVRFDDAPDPAFPISTAARVDLTVLLSRIIGTAGPLHNLLVTAKQLNVGGQWQKPGVLGVRIRCSGSKAGPEVLNAARPALREVAQAHNTIVREAHIGETGGPRTDPAIYLVVDLRQSAHGLTITEEWREYLIKLIQEQRDHRRNDMSYPGFFHALRALMPEVAGSAATPAEHAREWSVVLHAVCDRFHAFFAGTLLRSDSSARSPVGALHDIKTKLSRLLDAQRAKRLTEADLIDFRRRVKYLAPTAEELLKRSIGGWKIMSFDLRAEMERRAGSIEQVFGYRREGVEIGGVPQVLIKAPKRQVLLAISELLSNAYQHAGDAPRPVSIEFLPHGVVISNQVASGEPTNRAFSTGKGASAALAWLRESGFEVSTPARAGWHSARIVLKGGTVQRGRYA